MSRLSPDMSRAILEMLEWPSNQIADRNTLAGVCGASPAHVAHGLKVLAAWRHWYQRNRTKPRDKSSR